MVKTSVYLSEEQQADLHRLSGQHAYPELHEAVDRLQPEQAQARVIG